MGIDKLGKELGKEISNNIIDKYKIYVKKVMIINSGIEGIDRTKAKIYPQKIKLNKEKEIIIFGIDLNNDGDIDKVYDINGNVVYYDFDEPEANIVKGTKITKMDYIKMELSGSILRKIHMDYVERGDSKRLEKLFLPQITDPEFFEQFFSDKYITLLDFVKIQKAFDKLGLDIKGKLKENIKKICKLEKEKYGTNEVCNKYKDLYEKTWKAKLEEFQDIIRKGTKQITTLGQQMYTYYYQEKELKEMKGYVDEKAYNRFMEELKERDIAFVKKIVMLLEIGDEVMLEKKINFGDFLEHKLTYKYLGNDEVKVTDGKKYIIINPFFKYIKIGDKEIGFGFTVDEEKIYKIEDVDKYIENKRKKALEYARKYIDLINKGYIIFYKERGLLKDFWKKDLKIEYIKNDNVRISDGKETIIMNTNTGKKYIIYKGRKVDFGLNPEKIEDALNFDLDKYNP